MGRKCKGEGVKVAAQQSNLVDRFRGLAHDTEHFCTGAQAVWDEAADMLEEAIAGEEELNQLTEPENGVRKDSPCYRCDSADCMGCDVLRGVVK